jgi:hypothetical protein
VTSLDAKLFTWYRLQTEHEAARARLKDAMASAADDVVLALNTEVQRLRGDMDRVLGEIDALRRDRSGGDNAA